MDNQIGPKYCMVTLDGHGFVDTVKNVQDVLPDLLSGIDNPDEGYTISPVEMTDDEFDALPEFQGF